MFKGKRIIKLCWINFGLFMSGRATEYRTICLYFSFSLQVVISLRNLCRVKLFPQQSLNQSRHYCRAARQVCLFLAGWDYVGGNFLRSNPSPWFSGRKSFCAIISFSFTSVLLYIFFRNTVLGGKRTKATVTSDMPYCVNVNSGVPFHTQERFSPPSRWNLR